MTRKISLLLSSAVLLLLTVYLSFADRFAFNFELDQDRHYELLAIGCLVLIVYSVVSVMDLRRQWIRVAICGLLLAGSCLDSANEYLGSLIVLFVCVVILCAMPAEWLLRVFFYNNLLFLLLQCGLVVYQYCKGQTMAGSFTNTGVLTIYLSAIVPSMLFVTGWVGGGLKKLLPWVGLVLLALIFLIVYKVQSRTALISLVIISGGTFYYRFGRRSLKWWIRIAGSAIIVVALLATVVYSGSIKERSAEGRLLVQTIALQHLGDHFWLGTGLGKFTWYYPQWQSDYFLHHPDEPLRLAAAESYIVFNEYLQLFETVGVLGFLGFIGVLIWMFTCRSRTRGRELFTIKLTCLSILICGAASYPFHVNVILFLFFLCLGLVFSLDERRMHFKVMSVGPGFGLSGFVVGLALFCFCLPGVLRRWNAAADWHRTQALDPPFAVQKVVYERLYPVLQQDPRFLSDYGLFLMRDSLEAPAAVRMLRKGKERFISRETMMALGEESWRLKDREGAIGCYEWLRHYIPYLFEPKFDLMKLYLETGDYARARLLADNIIKDPPKVPSAKVRFIKDEAARLMPSSVPLGTGWRMKPGDGIDYSASHQADTGWRAVETEKDWQHQGYADYFGYAGYEVKVVIPSSLKLGQMGDKVKIGLGLIAFYDQAFLNGHLIGENNVTLSDTSRGDPAFITKFPGLFCLRSYMLSVNDPRIKWDQENRISVRVYSPFDNGGLWGGRPEITMQGMTDFIVFDRSRFYNIIDQTKMDTVFMVRNAHPSLAFTGDLLLSARDLDTGKEIYHYERKGLHIGTKDTVRVAVSLPVSMRPVRMLSEFTETRLQQSVIDSSDIQFVLVK